MKNENNRFKFAHTAPYPKVMVTRPNKKYAEILQDAYAGRQSEMTAVTQYVYQDMCLREKYPDVGQALHGISLVEMHHLDLLGSLIFALGMLPTYSSIQRNKVRPWTGENVNDAFTLKRSLQADIRGEKQAILEYEKILGIVDDEQIRCLIRRIIQDEELHIKILSRLYEQYFG